MTFDLDTLQAARRQLVRRLRPQLGAFLWVAQGPGTVRPGSPERLGLHVIAEGRPIADDVLASAAERSGFGRDVDVRPIDGRANSAAGLAGYVTRSMRRDGHRLSEHHGRVVLAWTSPSWPRAVAA